ncbi:MAG: hypothetical protein JXA50_02345 [Deltaproteobacteria bacterium]|nr:hypothetical protein [Deltaproteobacteria bacterium]
MKYTSCVIVLLFLLITGCTGGGGDDLKEFFPSSADVPGIREDGKSHIYVGTKLFDYMNGGAELYYEYGFVRMGVQRYQTPPGGVTAEIYEMDLPGNAYGIYTFDTQGEHPSIGQDATYEGGLLSFWKGKYCVRIFSEGEELKETILVLGQAIAQKILEEGERPDILNVLPSRGIVGDSLLYFRGMVALNNAYFLSHQDVLSLREGTEGITFQYKPEAQPLRVIIVRYPAPPHAEEAFQNLLASEIIREGTMNNEIFQGKSRKGYGATTVVGDLVILVLDGPDLKTVTRTVRSLAQSGGEG